MEKFLLKMKEYNSFVSGSWFVAEVLSNGSITLKHKIPCMSKTHVYCFSNEEDFLNFDCREVLEAIGFIQVKDL